MRVHIIPLLLCLGCGSQQRDIHPDLRPLLDYYLSYALDGGNIEELVALRYGTSGTIREARCDSVDKDFLGVKMRTVRQVVVLPPDAGFEYSWKATVMHELGHCLHGLKHSKTEGDIMYPFSSNEFEEEESYWRENLDKKMRELFPEGGPRELTEQELQEMR